MALVDWAIVIVIVVSVLGGLSQGFFRAVFALGGLVFGLVLAAWNYGRIAALLTPMVHIEPVANAIGFILIALLVMALASILGTLLAKIMHRIGLGCLDRLAGAAFGFLQGVLLVTLCILVAVAFFPRTHWLVEARLPRQFFGVLHLSTHMSPEDLARRVREGLNRLERESPEWMHPDNAGV